MAGIELQRRIRFDRQQLPMIFVSGHYDDEIRRKGLEGSAIAFLISRSTPVICWQELIEA